MSIDHGMSIDEVERLAASLRDVATRSTEDDAPVAAVQRDRAPRGPDRPPHDSSRSGGHATGRCWIGFEPTLRASPRAPATTLPTSVQPANQSSPVSVLADTQAVAMESRILANRHRVEGERERLRTKLSGKQGARLLLDHPGEYESELRRFELYERVLRENRQILFFDPQGDGEIAVAAGDVRTAKHLAVTVPGISNKLDNYWTLLDDADRLRTSAGEDTAVVAWLGYDTPIKHRRRSAPGPEPV